MSNRKSKFFASLLIGTLSMFYAEILSGSSQIWFLDLWGLLITFPLYMTHTLFYLNLGMRCKRKSIGDLYLWGILFALYEAPLTKVLWIGYPGSEGPIMGIILGVAFYEFIVLVLFWHPIMSFILPIIIFETFIVNSLDEGENSIISSHFNALTSKKGKKWVIMATFFPILFLPLSTNFDLFTLVLAFFGTVIIIFCLKKVYFRVANKPSIYDLRLGKSGFTILIIYLILLYIFLSLLLAPEKFPPSFTGYYFIIITIIIVLFLLKKSPESKDEEIIEYNVDQDKKGIKFFKIWLIYLVISLFITFIPEIAYIIASLAFLVMFPIGIIILLVYLKNKFNR